MARFLCYDNIIKICQKEDSERQNKRIGGMPWQEQETLRDKAKNDWLKSGGKISTKDIAAAYNVSEAQIRKWKSADKWQTELESRKRGGQKGNKNAAGHGAPKGNKNAETHGAYSTVCLDKLPPDEQEYIDTITLDAKENMLRELRVLLAKEQDLTRRIKEYEQADASSLYVDRVVEVYTPKANDNETKENDNGKPKLSAETVIKASPFNRIMKLESECNKIHGRIIKLIDSIRAYEVECKRINLDERKHELSKQRITGEYNIDPETGEINDTPSAENCDIDI